jgi:hypothetical protein
MKFGHIFSTFCPIWIQFRAQDARRYLLVTMGFVNEPSDSHTFHSDINKCTPVFFAFFSLSEIWHMEYEHVTAQHF